MVWDLGLGFRVLGRGLGFRVQGLGLGFRGSGSANSGEIEEVESWDAGLEGLGFEHVGSAQEN